MRPIFEPTTDECAPGIPEMKAVASVEIPLADELETPLLATRPLGAIDPLSPYQDSVLNFMGSTAGAPRYSFSDNDLSSPASTNELDLSLSPPSITLPHISAGLGMKFGLDLSVQAHLHSQSSFTNSSPLSLSR